MGRGGIRESITTTYSYDKMNRLLKEERPEGGERYTYDQAGNRLTKTRYHYALKGQPRLVEPVIDFTESYCYNEGNQLTERRRGEERTTYTYDENGSLLKEETTRGTAKGRQKGGKKEKTKAVTRYHYDFLNRQIRADLPEGRRQEAFYDGEGLRAGLTSSKGESYTFFYHQGELLGEEKAEGFFKSYVRGHGLVGIEIEDNQYYSCHLDEQGSTIYLTEGTGEEKNRYQYDAFGNLMEQEEGIQNRILYTGQQYDRETDQYYLRARYYHPNLGRFMQEDSYRGDGLNLYAYCANNPVLYYDPSGHDAQLNQSKDTGPTPNQVIQDTNRKLDPYVRLRENKVTRSLSDEEIEALNRLNVKAMYEGDRIPETDPFRFTGEGESGTDTTRVGRWMSQDEYDKMFVSGKVQMSGDNKVHVANPADINEFGKQAPKGSIYVEFDVPGNTISKGGADGWGMINGPGSLLDRLYQKKVCLEL